MTKLPGKLTLGRRQFLGILGASASIAAAIPAATVGAAEREPSDEKRKSRYRESEHIKTFYRVNRYPS